MEPHMRSLVRTCTRRLPATTGYLFTAVILALPLTTSYAASPIENDPPVHTEALLDLPEAPLSSTSDGQETVGKESTLFEESPSV